MHARLIKDGVHRGAENMGRDEALLRLSSTPVFRLYGWNPPCVSIGYFQQIQEEVDLSACARYGVDVVRRITGGGAVFHENEITYSFIAPLESHPSFASIEESYRTICRGIVVALARVGISATFSPINDVLVNGKKVSGSAQTRKEGKLLQHGTLILKLDVEKMFSLLRVSDAKIRDKMIQNVRERVAETNLSYEDAESALIEGFQEALRLEYVESSLTKEEEELAQILSEKKYAQREWLFFKRSRV